MSLFAVQVTYVPNRVSRTAKKDGYLPYVALDRTVTRLARERFETRGGLRP